MSDCENDDLRLMGEYDFKTPIIATIMYEDKEEYIYLEKKEPNKSKVIGNVEKIIAELIKNNKNKSKQWAKIRMHYPVLTDLLQPENNAIDENTNRGQEQQGMTNNVNNRCVFRSGPAGRELTICVSDTVINNNQSTTHQYNLPYNVSAQQNSTPTDLVNNTKGNSTQGYQNKQIPTHPYESILHRKKTAMMKAQQNLNQESFAPSTTHQYNLPYNVSAQQNSTPTALVNNTKGNSTQGYQNKQIPTHPYESILHRKKTAMMKAQQNLNQESFAPKKLPPPYSYPHYKQQAELLNTVNTLSYATTQFRNPARSDCLQGNQQQMDVNRSLSRDSGYMSPFLSSNEPSCSPRYEFDTSASATPLITHVTSLNPGVTYFRDGACHVCGKLTTQKCVGCYKYYYCSRNCQSVDWKYHYFNCK